MALAEIPRPVNILERVRIVGERDGLPQAYVPLSLIYREDVAVDESHVKELEESMRDELGKRKKEGATTGQLSDVLLAQVPGFDRFPIIDGFHRVAALVEDKKNEAFATIRTNTSWDELINLRITTAVTHKAVRFARLITWMEDSWEITPWSEKVNVSQAFRLRISPVMTGTRIGLSQEEAKDIKDWVDRKCEQWRLSPGHIYNNILRVAQTVDPELIKKARERKGGWALQALTPQHLKELSLTLPGRYDLQNLVAEVAIDKALTVPATRAVAEAVSRARTEEEAQYIIKSLKEKGLLEFKRLPKPELSYDKLLEEFFQSEIRVAQLSIQNAILEGRFSSKEVLSLPNNIRPRETIEKVLSLPANQRRVLVLVGLFKLDIFDVAQILKRPLADTRTDLQKAMARNSV